MLGVEFFRDIVEIQKRYAPANRRISNDLQTSATLLDDEWCLFLKENDFLVGVSIDGPRELHDTLRMDRWNRIPVAAWALMVIIGLVANLLVGYGVNIRM